MCLKDRMDPSVIKKLALLKEDYSRNPLKAAEGRSRFMRQAQELSKSPTLLKRIQADQRERDIRNAILHKPVSAHFMRTFVSIMLAIIIVLGSGWMTVYASHNSLPQEFLYPVKLACEDIALSLVSDPVRQFELSDDFVQNRSSEIILMLSEGKIPSDKVMNRYQAQVDRAVAFAASLPDDQAIEALTRLENRLEVQNQAFGLIKAGSSDEAENARENIQTNLGEQIKQASKGQTDLVWLRQMIEQKKERKITATSTATNTMTPSTQEGTLATEIPGNTGSTKTPGNSKAQATHTHTPGGGSSQSSTSVAKTHTPPAYGQGGKEVGTSTPEPTTSSDSTDSSSDKSNNGKHKGQD